MKKLSGLLIAIFLLTSCGSNYLKSYENVSKTKNNYDKIVVVGRSSDEMIRIKFENDMVQYFSEQGITAVASHTINETKNIARKLSNGEMDAMEKQLVQQGFDGCVITSLVDSQEYEEVIPGNSNTNYYTGRFGRFGRGYSYYPVTTWQPDQVREGVKYIFQSSFYQLSKAPGENLQWIGRFEVKDPYNIDKITNSYAKELVNSLNEESISE